jgi:hypothetical protein
MIFEQSLPTILLAGSCAILSTAHFHLVATQENQPMHLIRFAYLSCSAATAIAAFVAAIYWYLSSRPTPGTTRRPVASISDAPEEYILGAQVDIGSIHLALLAASRLNKKAALWSAAAAFLGGLTFAIGLA